MSDLHNSIEKLKEIQSTENAITEAKKKPNVFVDTPEARKDIAEFNEELLNIIPNGWNTNGYIEYVNPQDDIKRVKIKVRLLSAEEECDIMADVDSAMAQKQSTNIKYQMYLTFCKVLSRASQVSSLCKDTDFKGISVKSFAQLPFEMLQLLYYQYMDWVEKTTPSPYELPKERLDAMIGDIKKKSTLFTDLERKYSVPIGIYFIELCKAQEERIRYLEEENANLLQMEN
jgi:hypothetical protein